MRYKKFQELELSQLGFGTMRLPLMEDGNTIDEAQVAEMTAYALEHGVNYFDTAYPYHGGMSEIVIGKILSAYPREKWYLASKYPGHQIASSYDPEAVFEEQLEKCGVDYFDFYLLHNVYENSIGVYQDPEWGILEYFRKQKSLGRIRHLGFSTHARPDTLEAFLDYAGDSMEFCQIQLNYLDWTLQNADAKVKLLNERGIPIWVMEPLRGGRLAKLSEGNEARLKELRPQESIASWAMRWLMDVPGVTMILSGMSSLAQMKDNVRTFTGGESRTEDERTSAMGGSQTEDERTSAMGGSRTENDRTVVVSGIQTEDEGTSAMGASQTEEECRLLLDIAQEMEDALPCTRCRYCCDGCPMGLDIPMLIHAYNDLKFGGGTTVPMQFDALPENKKPAACLACGACAAICPQKIDIPKALADFSRLLAQAPSWAEICRQREEAAKKLRGH